MWIKLWQFRLSLSVTRATAQLSRCNGKEPRELDKAEPEALSKPSCGRETQSPGVFPQPRLIRKGWRCLGKKLDWKSAPTRSFPYQEKRQGSLRPSEMARKRCGWLSVIPLLIVAERVVEGLQISRTNVGDTTPPPERQGPRLWLHVLTPHSPVNCCEHGGSTQRRSIFANDRCRKINLISATYRYHQSTECDKSIGFTPIKSKVSRLTLDFNRI